MTGLFRTLSIFGFGSLIAVFLLSTALYAQSPQPGKNIVNIRGWQQEIYYYPAAGQRLNRKLLFAPGDGGWRGWAITVARTIASWGYDVYGLDTKTYLVSLNGRKSSREEEVMADFRDIARWMTRNTGERVTLIGWSEGAGLGVLAAADGNNKKVFAGLLTFGLGDVNVLGWNWRDNVTYVTGATPNEPVFHSSRYIPGIAPLPLMMIQASGDKCTLMGEAQNLASAAKEPKRFAAVQATDHKFSGGQSEFFRALREGLQWMS